MSDIDSRVKEIFNYLLNNTEIEIGETEIRSIKSSLILLQEVTPTDISRIFNKLDEVIKTSADLGYTISILKKYKYNLLREYKNTKDPIFTSLVKKGRPSIAAIESEMRVINRNILDLESSIDIVSNIIEYLDHIELCLDRYIWAIKDRISISKL